MKVKLKPKTITATAIPAAQDSEALENFISMMDGVEESLVDRSTEITAAKLCILTGGHLMLEGPHGTAKSLVASSIFKHIVGANCFTKQFTAATERDEIYGPMLAKKYREEGVFEHNIEGHLPTADFFFADEVYRASGSLLSILFGILNERLFMNGSKQVKCPLVTAIGTTNFRTEGDELAAFHDRWHVRIMVNPLRSESEVLRMLSGFLSNAPAKIPTVTMAEIQSLRERVPQVTVPADILRLYAEICHSMGKAAGVKLKPVSDRRKCAGIRFLQAGALMNERSVATEEDIQYASYVLITGKDTEEQDAWNTHYGKAVQAYACYKAETVDLDVLDRVYDKLLRKVSDGMPHEQVTALYSEAAEKLGIIRNAPADKLPTSQTGISRRAGIVTKLEELVAELREGAKF